LGQRGSSRAWFRKEVDRLMLKLGSDSSSGQSSNKDIGNSRTERRKSRTCEKEAWQGEASDGFSTIMPVASDNSLAQPASRTSGGPNSYTLRGKARHLLQRLRSAKAAPTGQLALDSDLQLVQLAHPKLQARSWLGRLSQGHNRKEALQVHPVDEV